MTDDPEARLPHPADQTGPEFDEAGDLEYDEAHGAGDRPDIPAALRDEARFHRDLAERH